MQFGYCLVWIVDFKTELPIAVVFGPGNAQDSPLTTPLLEQACDEHPQLARRCEYLRRWRRWNAVEHCTLFAAIAMLGGAWVAVKTGHPEKIRSAAKRHGKLILYHTDSLSGMPVGPVRLNASHGPVAST